VAYINVEANHEYQFRFKRKMQWLIDEKYPTVPNCYNSFNNVIITYEVEKEATSDIPETGTPIREKINKEFAVRTFEWQSISREFELPYKRVEGHSMCCIGDYIYIFGGTLPPTQATAALSSTAR
jgi:allophanate hydrolase subunit 1